MTVKQAEKMFDKRRQVWLDACAAQDLDAIKKLIGKKLKITDGSVVAYSLAMIRGNLEGK